MNRCGTAVGQWRIIARWAALAALAVGLLGSLEAALATPQVRTLYRFKGGSDGGVPRAGLVIDNSGALYGTTSWGTVFRVTPPPPGRTRWHETVLHSFGGPKDGW